MRDYQIESIAEKAKKNLRAKGVKMDGTTLTIPKVAQLGIKGWGYVAYLVDYEGQKVVRS